MKKTSIFIVAINILVTFCISFCIPIFISEVEAGLKTKVAVASGAAITKKVIKDPTVRKTVGEYAKKKIKEIGTKTADKTTISKDTIKAIKAWPNSWSGARQRYWRERAKDKNVVETYGSENVERMKKGRAPRQWNEEKGRFESKELHHNVPQRDGGVHTKDNLKEV